MTAVPTPDVSPDAAIGHTPVALVRIRFTASPEAVAPYVEAHRDYLDALAAAGTVLLAGPLEPRTRGVVIVALPPDLRAATARVAAVRDGDPYVRAGVAAYDTVRWHVRIGRARLDRSEVMHRR